MQASHRTKLTPQQFQNINQWIENKAIHPSVYDELFRLFNQLITIPDNENQIKWLNTDKATIQVSYWEPEKKAWIIQGEMTQVEFAESLNVDIEIIPYLKIEIIEDDTDDCVTDLDEPEIIDLEEMYNLPN